MGLPQLVDGRLRVLLNQGAEVGDIDLKTPEPVIEGSPIHFACPSAKCRCGGQIIGLKKVRILLKMTVAVLGEPARCGEQQILVLRRLCQQPFDGLQSERHRLPYKVRIIVGSVDRVAADKSLTRLVDHHGATGRRHSKQHHSYREDQPAAMGSPRKEPDI